MLSNMLTQKILFFLNIFLILIVFCGFLIAFAWNSPINSPPNPAGQFLYINNGKVGIGTTTPQQNLHIYNSGVNFSLTQTNSGDTAAVGYELKGAGNTNTDWSIGTNASNIGGLVDTLYFNNNGNYKVPLVIQANGNVGIGTIYPNYALDIKNGTIDIASSWDNKIVTTQSGKHYDLIGTYSGWDSNGVYIAGYNATNNISNASTTAVYIGGQGSNLPLIVNGTVSSTDYWIASTSKWASQIGVNLGQNSCYWSPVIAWSLTQSYTCNLGYYAAGLKAANGGESGSISFYQILCCHP